MAHAVVEAEKSHHLRLQQRIREAGGVIQPEFKGPRTREASSISSCLSLNAQELGAPMSKGRRWMSQFKQEESQFALPLLFCSIQAFSRLDDAPPEVVRAIFTPFTDSNANLFLRHPHRHTQK